MAGNKNKLNSDNDLFGSSSDLSDYNLGSSLSGNAAYESAYNLISTMIGGTQQAAKEAWFDYATYMTNKLHRLQEVKPEFTANQMFKVFNEKGFAGTDGALNHFAKYGADEDVSPNEHFDAEYYYRAKALHYYTTQGGLTKDQVLENIDKYALNIKGAINNAGMNAWTHYIRYGTQEGINPSNDFDTSAYMQAKCDALNAAEAQKAGASAEGTEGEENAGTSTPARVWTIEEVYAAFKEKGMSALTHFYKYGGNGNTNEVADKVGADGKIPDTFKVTGDEILKVNTTSSSTILTKDIDMLEGTNGNETFTGITGGTDSDTYTAADTIKDPSQNDNDVLNLYVSRAERGSASDVVSITNIEQINISHTQKNVDFTMDMGDVLGTNQIASRVGSGSEIILDNLQSLNTEVGLTGAGNLTAIWSESATVTENDTVHVSLDSAGVRTSDYFSKSSNVDVSSNGQIETVAINTSGTNYVTINGGEASNYTIVGTGKNFIQFDSASTAPLNVDASAAENSQTLDFSLQSRNENVTGSANDDVFIFGTRMNANDVIDGGEGNDLVRTDMATSVGTMKGVENMEVVQVAKAMTFDGKGIQDLTGLTVKNVAGNAIFRDMNPELTKLSLDSCSNQEAKTNVSWRLNEEGNVQANSVAVTIGQDNASGIGAAQSFGDVILQNVKSATITSFADNDNAGTVTNKVGLMTTHDVDSLAVTTDNGAHFEFGGFVLDGTTKLSLTAIDETSLKAGAMTDMFSVKTYEVNVGKNAVLNVNNVQTEADSIEKISINVDDNAFIEHNNNIVYTANLDTVDINLGELVTVRENSLSSINFKSQMDIAGNKNFGGSLDSYSFTSKMLANNLTLNSLNDASGIGSLKIDVSDQASHGVTQEVTAKAINNISLSVGTKGYITETLHGNTAEGGIGDLTVAGNGTITVTADSFNGVKSVNSQDMTGVFTFDMSGITVPDGTEAETLIHMGKNANTITGANNNVEIYSFSVGSSPATFIHNFKGAEDKLDFSTLFGNNTPGVIGGNGVANSLDTLAANTTGEVISLVDMVFFAGADVANIIDIMDGYSLQAGQHAVALQGTNGPGSELTAYLLTGNADDTISSETDMVSIGKIDITGSSLIIDDFVSAA